MTWLTHIETRTCTDCVKLVLSFLGPTEFYGSAIPCSDTPRTKALLTKSEQERFSSSYWCFHRGSKPDFADVLNTDSVVLYEWMDRDGLWPLAFPVSHLYVTDSLASSNCVNVLHRLLTAPSTVVASFALILDSSVQHGALETLRFMINRFNMHLQPQWFRNVIRSGNITTDAQKSRMLWYFIKIETPNWKVTTRANLEFLISNFADSPLACHMLQTLLRLEKAPKQPPPADDDPNEDMKMFTPPSEQDPWSWKMKQLSFLTGLQSEAKYRGDYYMSPFMALLESKIADVEYELFTKPRRRGEKWLRVTRAEDNDRYADLLKQYSTNA